MHYLWRKKPNLALHTDTYGLRPSVPVNSTLGVTQCIVALKVSAACSGKRTLSSLWSVEPLTQLQSQVQSRTLPPVVHPRTRIRRKRRGGSLKFLPTVVGAGHPSFGGWRTSVLPRTAKRLLWLVVPRSIATLDIESRRSGMPSERTATSRRVFNAMRAFPNMTPNPSFQRTASGGR